MSESLLPLAMACSLFVLGHVLISSTALRGAIVRGIGEGPYLGLFSVAVTAPLVWMISAFGDAPREILWESGPALSALPLVTMPFAMIFLVASLWGSNPTLVAGAGALRGGRIPGGIMRITRHPMLWAILLWAISHLLASGDRASLLFFGAFFLLASAGPYLIDRKRKAALGADWAAFAAVTSNVPFAAIIGGRNHFSLGEIGWGRIVLGLVLYLVVLGLHEALFGIQPY